MKLILESFEWLLLLGVLLVFLVFLARRKLEPFLVKHKVVDPGQYTLANLTNIVSVLIACFALAFSFAYYRQGRSSAKKQQDALDASRDALETSVSIARAEQKQREEFARSQQELLAKNLQATRDIAEAASRLLEITKEEREEQKRRQARQPRILVSLGSIPWEQLRRNPTISLKVGREGFERFLFEIRNAGDVTLTRGTVVVTALPESVKLDTLQTRDLALMGHKINVVQLGAFDVLPGTTKSLEIYISRFRGLQEFVLHVRIEGEGIKSIELRLPVKVVQGDG